MCGIAGFSLSRSESLDTRKLTRALLASIEVRGKDATGIAYRDGDKVRLAKTAVPASRFGVDRMAPTTVAILHTRFATKGSPENNANNHPIVSGNVVGVHNGHLSNDDAVFDYLGVQRNADVDSEAAFALINRSKVHPTKVLASLEGRAALAWINLKDANTLHLARVAGSPLAIGQTRKGSLIFASTADLLRQACWRAGLGLAWSDEIEEWTYLKVRNGIVHECLEIGDSIKDIA